MKQYKVRITDSRPKFKVGDKVSFDVNGVTLVDEITHISGTEIEGKVYCLTFVKMNKIHNHE